MGNKMLIDATHSEETRVVVAKGSRIEEFDFESASRKPLKGNIYLAKVTRVEPSLQAAFVEYGGNRHGFLAFTEIHPDYYQIPIADRLALIKEQEEEAALEAEDDDDDDLDGGQDSSGSSAEPDEHHDGDSGHHDHDDSDEHPESHEPVEAAAETVPAVAEPEESISTEAESENEVAAEGAEEESEIMETETDPVSPETPPTSSSGEVESVEEDSEGQKVDSVGAEDALEEVPRRMRRPPRRRYKIQEVIKRRQILLVQVVKEERGNKGAALTTYLSLAGRYCVLMPNTARGGGISRKITDAGDRRRLKEVARDIEIPQGMGLIVRTAGAQRTRPEIKRDFDYLIRLWESVRDLTLQSQAPSLVYEEGSLIKRSIRDLYTKDVDEVVVEGEEAYREAKDFMKMLMPSHAKNVKLYKDARPLFARYQVESHLDALFSPTVTLPSGGYLVINQTEALVSIDINSGKSTREHSIEDTALRTNLEACDEIARQLRLRDLAGLVVIDFIDMEEHRNNRSVERRMKEALKHDRARIQVGRISHFGLLEMSRQRLRPGLTEGTFRTCPHCEGRGIVRSVSSCGLGVLRSIEEYLQNKRAENLTVKCAREVAFYLLNEKRDSLLTIEQAFNVTIFVVPGGDDLRGTQSVIERASDREHTPRRLLPSSPVQIDSAFTANEEEPPEESASEPEDESEESSAAEASEEQQGEQRPGRRRRRRGGRGGRNRDRDRDRPNSNQQGADSDPEPVEFSPASSEGNEDERPPVESGGEEETRTAEPTETVEAGDDSSGDDRPPRREPGEDGEEGDQRRRGRFGRNRGRRDRNGEGRNGRDRGERGPRRERGEGERPQAEFRPTEFVEPVKAAPKIEIPDVIPDPEPRKWQPPAPTVAAEQGERKSGWWSRRK
jgi:ribonuclease E